MSRDPKSIGGLAQAGKFVELRQRLLFVFAAMIVYRLGTYIPVPGVDPQALLRLMEQQKGTILDMFNMFSGGALSRMSIFALNVMPYITASIVIQMLAQILPSLQGLRKEGQAGQRKITQWTRYASVGLGAAQSFGVAVGLQSQHVVYAPGPGFILTAVVALTAGTMFLTWLGEQITERGVGNGVSLIIEAGIVAGLPGAVISTVHQVNSGEISSLAVILIFALVLLVLWFVVFVESGQRRITVNYARRQGGRQAYLNQTSHLPLKLNMSGVIPPIFASSLIVFPATAAAMAGTNPNFAWLHRITDALAPGEPLHMVLYGGLIIGFTFFYTALTFNSQETAENLKKSGALIPGIRPGKATADYVDAVLTRLTLAGALYLTLVCLLPETLQKAWAVPFYFGGTSLLIVVVVLMDFIAQIQAHLMSHQYESLLKKANLKSGAGKTR
ncbi:MAG: preprotein translocase subunit SecY [Proteobacteria bacterium]|nr:preprotein translocase subunit SecY [Pseudomonadota bacterium]MBS0461295.1 preprotein translocase subunit SecY [Pseudomonadota bacterium]MBS0464892.1 preprotein translocase subunit SecY [Pseudomonadota bacterium]